MTEVTASSRASEPLAVEVLARVRTGLEASGLDAVVVMAPENIGWVAGAAPPSQRTVRSRHAFGVVPLDGSTTFITVALEGPYVRGTSWFDDVLEYEEFVQDPVSVLADRLTERGLATGRIGIEERYLPVADGQTLNGALPGAEIVSADALLSQLRTIKTPTEIAMIRDIGQAAERIAVACCAAAHAGMTEQDLAQLITAGYAEAGGDQLTMLVVGSGPRSARINAPPTTRVLECGDIVRLDIIGTKDCYYSDVARTAVVGKPNAEHRHVYDELRRAHETALASLRPGVSAAVVYDKYRAAMDAAGLPAYHFLGHGLGVTLHELPFLNAITSTTLEEDMVLCIEPLTMIPGRFGMQLEDELLITANGYEPFTQAADLLRIPA